MPRIGQVIRDVYRRPGTGRLPAHLAAHYGIAITGSLEISAGVLRVEQAGGPPWIARLSVLSRPAPRVLDDAGVLRFLAQHDFPAERCAHPEPVSELGGRAVLVTEAVPGQPCRRRPHRTGRSANCWAGCRHCRCPLPGNRAALSWRQH